MTMAAVCWERPEMSMDVKFLDLDLFEVVKISRVTPTAPVDHTFLLMGQSLAANVYNFCITSIPLT